MEFISILSYESGQRKTLVHFSSIQYQEPSNRKPVTINFPRIFTGKQRKNRALSKMIDSVQFARGRPDELMRRKS